MDPMRFFRLTSLVHIFSLATLLAFALPFASHGGADRAIFDQLIAVHFCIGCEPKATVQGTELLLRSVKC